MIQTLKNKFTKAFRKYLLGILWDKFLDNKPNNKPSYQIIGNVVMGLNSGIREGTIINVADAGQLIIGNNCYIGKDVEIGVITLIQIGDYTSLQDRNIILGDVEIQRYCLFAPNVYMSSGKHDYDLKPAWNIKDQDSFVVSNKELSEKHSKKITIEEDCWIGINAVVMRGVKIGKGTVVGANSVVTKDTQPYSVVAGAPAKLIKQRLAFIPPKSIEYNKEDDLPYFYMGFITRRIEREKYEKEKYGIAAMKNFKVALKCDKQINLVIKSLNQKEGILSYNSQKVMISNEYQPYKFDVINGIDMHEFFFEHLENINEAVIIQKIWSS